MSCDWVFCLQIPSGKSFPGFTTLGILDEIQKMMTESKCEPEQFKGRVIFMSVYNNIVWGEKRKQRNVYCEFSSMYQNMQEDSRQVICRFQGLNRRRNGTELMSTNLMENGIKLLRT